jgi:hypothetical protein
MNEFSWLKIGLLGILMNRLINRDTGFSDFVHRPDSKLLKTQCFGNWICFRPQVREDTYSVGSLRKSYPQSLVQSRCLPSPKDGNIQFPKRCVFSNYHSGRWTKSKNPVSLCVIHHHQKPIVSRLINLQAS